MSRSLDQEWEAIVSKEEKSFDKIEKKMKFQKPTKIDNIKKEIMAKIPDKMIATLDAGFYKAFQLIFAKGIGIIGKTFNETELSLDFAVNDFRVNGRPNSKSLRQMEKAIKKGNHMNTWASVAEGIGLGIVGVGLPDIPIFLGVLLKGIYEASLGYGFNYKKEKEQVLILKMITAALSEPNCRKENDAEVEAWISKIDEPGLAFDMDEEMKKASNALSKAMLLSKFIQGFFIVGIIGGISNPVIYQKTMHYVLLKYKKRYINQKRIGIKTAR